MEENLVWPGWDTVKILGQGAFGTVYEVQRRIFDDVEKAAVKVISIPHDMSEIGKCIVMVAMMRLLPIHSRVI